MADQVERAVQRESTAVEGDGAVVQERTRSTSTQVSPKATAANIIWYIYGFISILLGLRFVLKLTGANPVNGFVDLVYSVSGALSAPFDSIFGVAKADGRVINAVFEPSILVAIAVYALIAWGLTKLLTLNSSR